MDKTWGQGQGRKKNIDDDEIRRLIATGANKAEVARQLKVSRMTVYRALAEQKAESNSI
ncbi:helix-turn-helix domain-containing protein [Rhizobium rhizogenes]|uniref:helix-turn-helix domain-containing protein n=1 Tax=Rhizobium rhizogenes TaxID=359 RepID=UPI001F267A0F|nr:helix-turn-helix domain-containing protein [Rhizobium rhizogenes]